MRTPKRPEVILRLALNIAAVTTISAGPVPARADLRFTEPVANAGLVYAGVPLVHEFTFENQGPETVTIIEARASCGCLRPRLAPGNYRRGEKGGVILEVNTLSQAHVGRNLELSDR